ncbi:conserved hypothetical protein [Mesorhizobium prunaredense]|uniref:Uncharacterized protein n=2 Tax=Mesorhizobium TaxID=68287 RepID=A0A1R3VAM9_9HYPH|nr:conserved hypothetical protein [Mesorhizobium ventifaucium]SIT55848.1 conserved hypothetical protein [Mesorhizobium prunaredense]
MIARLRLRPFHILTVVDDWTRDTKRAAEAVPERARTQKLTIRGLSRVEKRIGNSVWCNPDRVTRHGTRVGWRNTAG